MIAKESIEQLKSRIDIVEILGNYIQLKRAGANYSACCPFHDEKTPSFMVSPAKGIYHCYGCGASGDAIAFVMEYEKLSFAESVEKIASMSGFSLTYTKQNQKQDTKILDKVAQFYHSKLEQIPQVLEYIRSRGISPESVKKFQLGFCGAGFESVKFVDTHNARSEAIECGLLGKDGDRVYSRFFERLMFPICSPNGKVVGFGGRTMQEDNNAKYINSPQSKVFNKSKLLYAYHLAKEAIYTQRQIIITEGYIDVIMMHQAGFKNVVATLGTALTRDHLPLLNKGEPKIIVSYDGDKAGINAAFKASKLLAGKEGGVVIFDGGADPADMVVAGKVEEIKLLLSSPIPFVEFVLGQIAQAYEINNPLQKEKALKESLEFLHTLSPILQEEYKPFLARLLRVPISLIRNKRTKTSIVKEDSSKNLTELVLLKSILEHRDFLDFAIEYLDIESFQVHFKEYELILKEEMHHPLLVGLSINPLIQALEFEDFKRQVYHFAISVYQQRLKQIPLSQNLGYKQKVELMRKYRAYIDKIQKGEI